MVKTLLKGLITIVMMGVIPVTGILYWGATNLKGKLSIALTGLLIYVLLAFWYSWLKRRPRNFTDWLKH